MAESQLHLAHAPIIEAVVDIDCDLPRGFQVEDLEDAARARLDDRYPQVAYRCVREHSFEPSPEPPSSIDVRQTIQALRFASSDGKQLVQIREQGFSFNRLAPYSGLDDYLAEIQRTWQLYVELACPVQITAIRLRYINSLPLPMQNGLLELSDYLKVYPQMPADVNLTITGFLHQHEAIELGTDHRVGMLLTALPPERGILPVVFDVTVAVNEAREVDDWIWIQSRIQALRTLKNRVFLGMLTERCLSLFR